MLSVAPRNLPRLRGAIQQATVANPEEVMRNFSIASPSWRDTAAGRALDRSKAAALLQGIMKPSVNKRPSAENPATARKSAFPMIRSLRFQIFHVVISDGMKAIVVCMCGPCYLFCVDNVDNNVVSVRGAAVH